MKIKQVFINIALLIFSFIIFMLMLEFILRGVNLCYGLKYMSNHHSAFCEYDRLLGWRHKTNIENIFLTSEFSTRLRFNSKGIRGPEYSYDKDKDEFRILIMGDSFAEGYAVNFNELFSEVMKDRLENRGVRCEVINAGVGGYSTDQELLLFQSEMKKYKPDLTILMFCSNDIWYNNQPRYSRGYKPYFVLNDGKLILKNVPVPPPDNIKNLKDAKEHKMELSLMLGKKWLSRHSYLYHFIIERVKNVGWLYEAAIKLNLVTSPEGSVLIPDEFKVFEKQYDSVVSNAWKVTEALLVEFRREAVAVNSRFIVFYIPGSANIYVKEWEDTKKKYNISSEFWSTDRVGIELGIICKKNNIDLVDSTEPMKIASNELTKNNEGLYYVKDGHWNIKGNKLVGELLAELIYSGYTNR
ncbi:MAG: SGNH/GDSL hydrolase family protein [Candidatus Omnitrophota bacterium]